MRTYCGQDGPRKKKNCETGCSCSSHGRCFSLQWRKKVPLIGAQIHHSCSFSSWSIVTICLRAPDAQRSSLPHLRAALMPRVGPSNQPTEMRPWSFCCTGQVATSEDASKSIDLRIHGRTPRFGQTLGRHSRYVSTSERWNAKPAENPATKSERWPLAGNRGRRRTKPSNNVRNLVPWTSLSLQRNLSTHMQSCYQPHYSVRVTYAPVAD